MSICLRKFCKKNKDYINLNTSYTIVYVIFNLVFVSFVVRDSSEDFWMVTQVFCFLFGGLIVLIPCYIVTCG